MTTAPETRYKETRNIFVQTRTGKWRRMTPGEGKVRRNMVFDKNVCLYPEKA